MKTKIVSHILTSLPPLTKAQQAALKALSERPESEIDYGDIPPLTDEQLRHARRGAFYRPVKRQITARVDADVLEWLKGQGKGYQSRINAILRREMLAASRQS
ncbi:BrnA antitoxin family protein [Terriglobus sp.]|uniref:BrnA antitoxin family protein n=1 Tax=Terriglobus sp. TaxID=1889013 RepID=UPI003B003DFE